MEASVAEPTELRAAAALNSLLAQAMNYPGAELAASLRDGSFAAMLGDALKTVGDVSLNDEIAQCGQDYKQGAADAEAILLDLERDYTRLFFASKPRLAYLFESVYREGKLMQDSTFEVAGLYRDAGLIVTEEFRLPPDHIAIELEFLSFLLFKEIEGIKSGNQETVEYARELQQTLLDKHLKEFVASLSEKIGMHARTPFYRTVARVLSHYFSEVISR